MDHLDLAGVLTTPPQWNLPVFEQQDALFLSSSRQMLEPIMEETSEDEECAMNSWQQYDQQSSASDAEGNITEGDSNCEASISNGGGNSFWSSAESDTGSVIRIEVTKDNDSHSERDFLCPAKRARRCDDGLNEEEVILRRPVGYGSDLKNNSLERFLNYENFSRDSWGNQSQQRSSLGSTRRGGNGGGGGGGYDDFYSDSDSLSYNSLSRSSSLIQFESLERQLLMQEQHASMTSLGNSSPSLLSFDMQQQEDLQQAKNSANNSGNNSRRGSQSSLLKKYESLDGRLHQTYYDLDKLNFDDMQKVVHSAAGCMKLNSHHHLAELRSDSEGSSSESSELSARPRSIVLKDENTEKFNRSLQSKKGKNSAENLSEDSGYCEPAAMAGFGLRRSKSSQTLITNYEKFSEEEEEEEMMENKSLNYKEQQQEMGIKSPPLSPQLEFIRHQQRHETHSPSPVSSERSTSSSQNSRSSCSSSCSVSASSSASSSSATTCASKASFTWLITSNNNCTTAASPLNRSPSTSCVQHDNDDDDEEQEVPSSPRACLAEPTQISINDLRLAETTSEENVHNFSGNLNRNINANGGEYCLECKNHLKKENCTSASLSLLKTCRNKCGENIICQKCKKENDFKNKNSNPKQQQQQLNEKEENCSNSENKTLHEFSERVRKKLQILSDAHSVAHSSGEGEFPIDSLKRNKQLKDNFEINSCPATPKTRKNSKNLEDSLPFKGLQRCQLYSLMPCWPLKTCSVPNDLNNIGRLKKKPQHQDPLPLLDQNPSDCLNIKKSSSWHGLISNYKLDVESQSNNNKNLALLHRSFYNLSALTQEESHKMSEQRLSSDYETEIVCKNNFLLDELSAHFDKTASILNDKPMDEEENVLLNLGNASPATEEEDQETEPVESEPKELVQHVQLVIRQPPARQKRNKDNEKANSLTQDFTFNAIMQGGGGKTFDQDPTILKTSYAQSLEKCNFDCKELSSTQDLQRARTMPKRRFQSQAAANKKKSLVSSTPNLNAFEQENDIEDDLFVSSAHTSMHQLPLSQTQKPLGILLPAGSRTSFGKEVSFCPVVSKYCWQEQSSEECNESGSQELLSKDEESEDELLDNADATVIYNTKENENIAAKFNEENFKREEQQQPLNKSNSIENEMIAKETNENELSGEESITKAREQQQNENEMNFVEESVETKQAQGEQMVFRETQQTSGELLSATLNTVSLATNVNNETSKVDARQYNNKNQNDLSKENKKSDNNTTTTVIVARPLSIQLPILSEPPINRAHHILYASQQMLDNFQKQQQHEQYEHFNKSQSTYNLTTTQQQQQKMASNNSLSAELQTTTTANNKLNNNNEVLKTKFKHEEKHPNSKGFLSRFANGFRFSLRRNKKKLQQQQKENQLTADVSLSAQAKSKSLPNNIKQQQDFIHIPLKGPLNKQQQQHNGNTQQTNGNAVLNKKQKGAKISSSSSTTTTTTMNTNDKQQQPQKVTGKPPIPPTMQKMQSAQSSQQQTQTQQQQPLVEVGLSRFYTETNNTTTNSGVYNPRSSTQDFLNTERFYHEQQQQQQSFNNHTLTLNNTANKEEKEEENVQINQENNFSVTPTITTTTMTAVNNNYDFSSSPSRASVSQKTQMFNNLSRQTSSGNNTQPKIGLIETNLDTHETIITGKTRSLINIAPQQTQLRSAGNKRHHNNIITNASHHHHLHQQMNADDEGYDDNDDDEVIVRPDGTVVVIKNAGSNDNSSPASQAAQIASVRRPHKSMEFLLDKENQKDVMVCTQMIDFK